MSFTHDSEQKGGVWLSQFLILTKVRCDHCYDQQAFKHRGFRKRRGTA